MEVFQKHYLQNQAGAQLGLQVVVCQPLKIPWLLQPSRGSDPAERLHSFKKSFEVVSFLSSLPALRVLAFHRRDAEGVAVCLGELRGLRGRARGHSGEGEGAQKLEPNQHRVQLASPNLQVTPRGGGGGGGGGSSGGGGGGSGGGGGGGAATKARSGSERLRAERRRARPIVTAKPSAELSGPGLGARGREPARAFSLRPRHTARGWAGAPRVRARAARRRRPSPPRLNTGGVRGRGGGGSGESGRPGCASPGRRRSCVGLRMRPGGALLALLASLLLLLLLRLLWCSTDAPARSRLSVEESRDATRGTPAALRTLRSPATQLPRPTNSTYLSEKSLQLTETCKRLQDGFQTLSSKLKRYLESDYLQIIRNIQSCPWKRREEEYENFR
ncbi:alpha-2,8-sialyltransferase 8F [Mustela putorius furo]|uniref:Alpha-2,8-sialyltransferase 8F n=1 Tax=Mustela putorius furo TaxID=9669 RepID=A0A8U0SDK5_MUSPF|nr:alpha-2,8-sialyltransferase 8F [Mustela putorius furo]